MPRVKKSAGEKIKKPVETRKKITTKKPREKNVRRNASRRVQTVEQAEQKRHITDIRKEIERAVKAERDKRFILWSGVIFFMVVIFVFWVYNLKDSFRKIESENISQSEFNWSEITGDFGKSMEEMKENLAEIKEFTKTAEETATSTEENIASSTRDIFSEQDELEKLRTRLEELEGRLGASSDELIKN